MVVLTPPQCIVVGITGGMLGSGWRRFSTLESDDWTLPFTLRGGYPPGDGDLGVDRESLYLDFRPVETSAFPLIGHLGRKGIGGVHNRVVCGMLR